LSRGAARVVFVDREREVIEQLSVTLSLLRANGAQIEQGDALRFLEGSPQPFDIVFLDPPFDRDLLPGICSALENHGWLAPGALIYIESPAHGPVPALPAAWALLKTGRAGEVGYHLARRGPSSAPGGTR
jgi:16S rRNA (guanine966-N2)-methyltransferase